MPNSLRVAFNERRGSPLFESLVLTLALFCYKYSSGIQLLKYTFEGLGVLRED